MKHLRVIAGLVVAFVAVSCGGGDGSNDDSEISRTQSADGNWFVNPGFEEGAEPWISLAPDAGFTVSSEFVHGGSSSALLTMRDPASASDHKVYYLVQEVAPPEFPEVVRGYYRVENWNKGTPRQYLQFVVIAFEPDNFPDTVSNYQIRYPLAGIDSPPFVIDNAFFVFLTRKDPIQGEWVPFEAHIKDDFQRLWGKVPEGFEKLRVLFEVRWDSKVAGDGAPEADVYYDDLYIGPPS